MTTADEIRQLWLTATPDNVRDHLWRAAALARAGEDGGYLEGLEMLFMASHPGEPLPEPEREER